MIFSLASLFLLIRGHVFDEQSEWVRRRIGDPASISSVYLRGGTIFIGLAVAGSMLLTQTASSAPLAGRLGRRRRQLRRPVALVLAVPADRRPEPGARRSTFGPNAIVQQQWQNNDDLAFTVQRPPDRRRDLLLARVRPTTGST